MLVAQISELAMTATRPLFFPEHLQLLRLSQHGDTNCMQFRPDAAPARGPFAEGGIPGWDAVTILAVIAGSVVRTMLYRSLILLPLLVAAALAGCKPENKFQPPPPPEISVAVPLQQKVTALRGADGQHRGLRHRRPGGPRRGLPGLAELHRRLGHEEGRPLFVIEQTMYKAKVKEAEAQLDAAKAQLLNAEAEFTRQETLLRQNVTAQNTYDQAKAKRDSAGPTSRTTKATSPSPRPTWATRRCRRRSTASCPSI